MTCCGYSMQHLWEDTGKLKDDLEDMEKKLLEGKMEIERTMDDYVKLKVCVAVFSFMHTTYNVLCRRFFANKKFVQDAYFINVLRMV